MPEIERYLLNLAGEYRVCSELTKRGVFATLTYGHRKGADVYVIDEQHSRALKIEVKTAQGTSFVTSITQKGLDKSGDVPDFWVLFQLRARSTSEFVERFFVLSHAEICAVQDTANRRYSDRHFKKTGKRPDFSRGVDNVSLADVETHEDQWQKIIAALTATAAPRRKGRSAPTRRITMR